MKYKAKDTFQLKTVAGEPILVARGPAAIDFGAMLVLNESGAFMWKLLENGCTDAVLAEKLANKYGIPIPQAQTDADAFLQKCLSECLLDTAEG